MWKRWKASFLHSFSPPLTAKKGWEKRASPGFEAVFEWIQCSVQNIDYFFFVPVCFFKHTCYRPDREGLTSQKKPWNRQRHLSFWILNYVCVLIFFPLGNALFLQNGSSFYWFSSCETWRPMVLGFKEKYGLLACYLTFDQRREGKER